ncbi:ABC transporter ATP-binding protein [Aliidongia dinghuensis]|uniref:ABC transporter ATP-binding protein n=1 Tax=Aliidongia dinghuensis TaxID=1867774 RepID=A0A8J3E5Q4_9PROT|nr:ABC transporter ATP-binding protein [Aliidongia dinghuensis]GGF34484.1 ABC transporter ATP-binding protein [Aliidongia dinghuensis]
MNRSATASLQLKGLSKHYGPVAAVEDVNLTIEGGELVTFLGASGSGKSTTLFMIAGLEAPTSGEILLGGRSLQAIPPHRRNIGMVFQRYSLFPRMTVAENIAFPLQVRRLPKAEIAARVARALDLVQLGGMADRRPMTLSGGQQQRVAVARALVYEPPLLLMDEPLGALDKSLREEIQVELKELHRRLDVTILFVTHDQDEALRLSDRIAVFGAGRIAQFGSPNELYHQPASRFVAGFFGNANFLAVTGEVGAPGLVRSRTGCVLKAAPNGKLSTRSLRLMVRPHEVRVAAQTDACNGENRLAGEIRDLVFMGDHSVVTVDLPEEGAVWTTVQRSGSTSASPLARGMRVALAWPIERTHLFAED